MMCLKAIRIFSTVADIKGEKSFFKELHTVCICISVCVCSCLRSPGKDMCRSTDYVLFTVA